jgi:hypothetical protein
MRFTYELQGDAPDDAADRVTMKWILNGKVISRGHPGTTTSTSHVGWDLDRSKGPYTITVIIEIPGYAYGSDTASNFCPHVEENASGQICFGRGAVAATVFVTGDSIDIYAIDPLDNGELVMSFTQEYLRTLPIEDEARLLGDSDRHIPIEFYRNANRLYRMVAGPDAEGKFFECTFDGACAYERTWIGEANRPTDEVVPVCAPVIVPTGQPTLAPLPTSTPLPLR